MRRLSNPTLLLLVLTLLAGCGEAPTGRRDAEQQSGNSKRGAGAERTSQPDAPKVIEFDPSTIKSPESKAFFDEGYAQGLRMADTNHAKAFSNGEPSKQQLEMNVKTWRQERDVAIQVAAEAGLKDPDALRAFGRKAGMKDGLAKHKIAF